MNARNPLILVPALEILLVASLGCMNNGIEWSELDFTRSKPDIADLVGTWVPTAATLRDMETRGKYVIGTHELRLAADGRCQIINMPDWWEDVGGKSKGRLESYAGSWKVVEGNDVWRIYSLELDLPNGKNHVHFARQKPPYVIHITLGDPDSGEYMEFERQPSLAVVTEPTGNPLEGRWVLDVSRSHYGGGAEPRLRETMTCVAQGDGVSCTIESVREDGRELTGRFAAAYDGPRGPVTGIPDVDEVSLDRVNRYTADATFRFHHQPVFAYRAVQSDDGRELTITSVHPTSREVLESVIVYERR